MEREPQNRYSTANEFAWDLEHLDQVGVADRPELRNWKQTENALGASGSLFYVGLALIPVVIFGLLLLVAKK